MQRENRENKKEEEEELERLLVYRRTRTTRTSRNYTMPWNSHEEEGEREGEASDPHNNQNTQENGGKKEL